MRKISLILLIVMIGMNASFAQELACSKMVKLYLNAEINSDYYYENGLDVFYLTPSIVINTKSGNYMEFEVSHLKYRDHNQKSNIDQTKTFNSKEFDFFFRYEYGFRFSKQKESDWHLGLGLSISPFFTFQGTQQYDPTFFSHNKTKIGLAFSAIPRLEYFLNDRWLLDFTIPIGLLSTKYYRNSIEDPSLTIEQRVQEGIATDVLNSMGLRVGVGFVL